MRKDFDKLIRELMTKAGIKTQRQLADKMNELALSQIGKKIISYHGVNKWLRSASKNRSIPGSQSLMFLAKALNASADLILYDEGENPERTKSLERMVSTIVKSELEKSGTLNKSELNKEFLKLLESDQIPPEEKEGILRQIRNLHKIYSKKSEGDDSDSIK